jgi:hypothetical protein
MGTAARIAEASRAAVPKEISARGTPEVSLPSRIRPFPRHPRHRGSNDRREMKPYPRQSPLDEMNRRLQDG